MDQTSIWVILYVTLSVLEQLLNARVLLSYFYIVLWIRAF